VALVVIVVIGFSGLAPEIIPIIAIPV